MAKIVLHFVFYIPLHYRLEVVETIKRLVTTKSVAWIDGVAKNILWGAMPSIFNEPHDEDETVRFLEDVLVDL